MRIKTNEKFYERKSQVSEPRSKHFIIFEGTKSEQIYFDAFLKKHEIITNVFFFLRDKEKEGWTNPQKIMELLISVINGNEKISFTYDTIFDNFYDYVNQYVTTITKKTMKNKYISEVRRYEENQHNPIDIGKLNLIINDLIYNYLEKYKVGDIFHDESILKELIEEQSTFDKDIDKIYLVVDRDQKSFTEEQYDYILEKTKENDVQFYVINPCFEFWLLLHFKDCKEYPKEQLIENNYVNADNTFVYVELKKCDSSYTKSKFNTELYIDKINIAIENSKKYDNDITLLKENVGTNIQSLLEELMSYNK